MSASRGLDTSLVQYILSAMARCFGVGFRCPNLHISISWSLIYIQTFPRLHSLYLLAIPF